MQIEILSHNSIVRAAHIDSKTKVATVKFFGVMHKFQEHEYKIIKEK